MDQIWMQRCLELARQGRTAPNPQVGCVIVQGDRLLGEGFHPQVGQPHAEVLALQAAQAVDSQAVKGATLYVNLEPCNHYGRTPPCTEAIIQAQIGRVVVGMIDPDPRVQGQGCDRLRAAGIEVAVGVLEPACQQLNEGFSHRQRTGCPWGILKYAITLDGKIATATGHSQWITGDLARQAVHQLRASCEAVITGGNTVRLDNPSLTTHGVSQIQPLRVILSPSLNLPNQAQVWDGSAPTLVFTQLNQNLALQTSLRDRGIEVIVSNDLTPRRVMAELGARGCNQVLWECGGKLAGLAIAAGAVQKVYAFIAPKIIGGSLSPVTDLGIKNMSEAYMLERTTIQPYGEDWLITGYLAPRVEIPAQQLL
ncbi:MAG: bifunctional diaminohydroxyphosphoribosylaminopyrimidine deaminase/5-amino-6-(5-phosphoribosylamino)uracil reductase RibD [Pseudanabaenaceae cyanobacterium bins.68]|nr:bifunctional diaminohydroxyphosphoribosylaminopyrimidine deaminase/5-amino-6-(5-phosphoribosylamino)uracil reductase RibD [Pseudanabaenaceae cyanobacterium bins.68]